MPVQKTKLAATGLPYEDGRGTPNDHRPGDRPHLWNCASASSDGMSKSFGVGLKLTDGDAAQSYLQLTFVSNPLFPVITSSSNAALVLNKFFSYTITADAPTTSLDYLGLDGTLDGSLPSGLSFDPATGTISGLYTGEAAPYDALAGRAPARQNAKGDSLTEMEGRD